MAKTWRSVLTALVLTVVSLTLFLIRWSLFSSGSFGTSGGTPWKVSLVAVGEFTARDGTVTTPLPFDFRQQHIFQQGFTGTGVLDPSSRSADTERHEAVWRRTVAATSKEFRLAYSFHCLTDVRTTTPAMDNETRQLDVAPIEDACLRPGPHIESEHKDVSLKAQELAPADAGALDQARAFFDYVAKRVDYEPSFGVQSALQCLRTERGDSGGQSRLLIALCRNRGIPARLMHGLILVNSDQERGLHQWAEAWVNNHWLAMCPTHNKFGENFPSNYLVLSIGDEDCIRSRGARDLKYGFLMQSLHDPRAAEDGKAPSRVRLLLQVVSLDALNPAEKNLARFLLLLPLGALIVSIYRTVIGIPTFGTFTPALLGLAFLDWKTLPLGMGIIFTTVMIGWGLRHLLNRFHLLMVPRLAILLTLIVSFLAILVVVASRYNIPVTHYISLFPLVILTHMVERFGTLEAEDGTTASFKALLCTFVVAATISLALSPDAVTYTLFSYPELLGCVLAIQFLLGRYTGYRLTELYRFSDLMQDETTGGAR